MWRRFMRIMVVVALVFFCLPAGAFAQSTEPITITSPGEGDSIVNTSAQIVGTAPPSTIVSVVITDSDTGRAGVSHQENGKVEGTVTSGADGTWSYVPQHTLVPGPFSVQASYVNSQNQVNESKPINFIVLNEDGSSSEISSSLVSRIIIIGSLVIVLIIAIVMFFAARKRKLNQQKIGADAATIEAELARTVDQLARTNAQIVELNKKIDKQKPPDGPPPGQV